MNFSAFRFGHGIRARYSCSSALRSREIDTLFYVNKSKYKATQGL